MKEADSINLDDLDDLIEKIGEGNVVPIVGNDLLKLRLKVNDFENHYTIGLNSQNNGIDGGFKDSDLGLMPYLLQELEKKYKGRKTFDYSNDCKEVMDKLNFIHSEAMRNKWAFYSFVGDIIKEKEKFLIYDTIDKLTCIKKFKLFINASVTSLVENSVRNTRASISNKIDVFSLNINDTPVKDIVLDSTINTISPAISPNKLKKIIVYNLYGKYEWTKGCIVVDDDILELTHTISNNRSTLKTLFELLTSSSLLFIGCNFPDWLLRFFIRMFSKQRLSVSSSLYTVADVLNCTDKNRAIFISNSKIKYFELDGNEFINKLYNRLLEKWPNWISNKYEDYIFLSYYTENRPKVIEIYDKLEENDCNIFMDIKRLEFGDSINNEVKKGIDNCKIFIPIISKETNMKSDAKRYFIKEWEYVIHLHNEKNPNNEIDKSPFIMPVFLDQINENELFGSIPHKFFDLKYQGANYDGFLSSEFIQRIKSILNKK